MVSLCVPSLFDLCGIRFAYRMWTRHDVTKRSPADELFRELIETVRASVQNCPLPERVKSRLWKHIQPVGKHLLSVLNILLSKTQAESSQKWLTGDMLFDCLVLNADGLINQRGTAKKLLNSRMLNDVFAFRLACIYFLETNVLKLWPLVKLYVLNEILYESESPSEIDVAWMNQNISELCMAALKENAYCFPSSFFSPEPHEVLSWIGYCLSKEKAIDITEVLDSMGISGGWNGVSQLEYDLLYNVACYEYFCNENVKYNHIEMIKKLFKLREEDHRQTCFIFHFNRLNFPQKAKLFELFPTKVISQFLQWPLSLTFVENAQEVWSLIPNEHKHWIFKKIVNIISSSNWKPFNQPYSPLSKSVRAYKRRRLDRIPPIHCIEHLKSIWIALWEISLDSFKFPVLDDCLHSSLFMELFQTSDQKEKLLNIFFKDGEVVFDLYKAVNLEESLKNLVDIIMPEHSARLKRHITLIFNTQIITLNGVETDFFDSLDGHRSRPFIVNRQFVSFIKHYLFSVNNIDKTFFINKLIHFETNF